MIWFLFLFSFFFQAEDGIRDDLVTGVQTCALPISPRGRARRRVGVHPGPRRRSREAAAPRRRTSPARRGRHGVPGRRDGARDCERGRGVRSEDRRSRQPRSDLRALPEAEARALLGVRHLRQGRQGKPHNAAQRPASLQHRPLATEGGPPGGGPSLHLAGSDAYGSFSVQAPNPCVVTYMTRRSWSILRDGIVVVGSPGIAGVQPVCERTRWATPKSVPM